MRSIYQGPHSIVPSASRPFLLLSKCNKCNRSSACQVPSFCITPVCTSTTPEGYVNHSALATVRPACHTNSLANHQPVGFFQILKRHSCGYSTPVDWAVAVRHRMLFFHTLFERIY